LEPPAWGPGDLGGAAGISSERCSIVEVCEASDKSEMTSDFLNLFCSHYITDVISDVSLALHVSAMLCRSFGIVAVPSGSLGFRAAGYNRRSAFYVSEIVCNRTKTAENNLCSRFKTQDKPISKGRAVGI